MRAHKNILSHNYGNYLSNCSIPHEGNTRPSTRPSLRKSSQSVCNKSQVAAAASGWQQFANSLNNISIFAFRPKTTLRKVLLTINKTAPFIALSLFKLFAAWNEYQCQVVFSISLFKAKNEKQKHVGLSSSALIHCTPHEYSWA